MFHALVFVHIGDTHNKEPPTPQGLRSAWYYCCRGAPLIFMVLCWWGIYGVLWTRPTAAAAAVKSRFSRQGNVHVDVVVVFFRKSENGLVEV